MTKPACDQKPILGYLSGAPRVSTHPEAELGGPRSHVLGVIRAFEALNWQVEPFIVGDRMPSNWVARGSEQAIRQSRMHAAAADAIRLGFRLVTPRLAWRKLGGQATWVYERFTAFQSLGAIFQRHGIPWILETNAPLFYEAVNDRQTMKWSGLARHYELKSYQDCDILVCVTATLRDIIVQEMNIPVEKTIVMPNGVDTKFFSPDKYTPRRFFNGFTVGFVGGLVRWQGLALLLEAVADVRQEGIPVNVTLVGDGLVKPDLERQVKTLRLAENVKFTGGISRAEIPNYIAGFDVGFSGQIPHQIGQMYGSPLKLYEYMAMGKPVIISSFEDARRAISHEKFGCLFEPGNKEELKRALRLVYKKRHSLISVQDEIRQESIANHDWVQRVTHMISAAEEKIGHSAPKANSRR